MRAASEALNVLPVRDPTLLGTVQDVAGSTVRVVLDESTLSGLTFIEGHGYRVGQIGAFVRIPLGYVDLFGIVSQVGAGAAPANVAEFQPGGQRWMTVQLAGQARRDGAFERGLAQYPTIGDTVHLVVERDLLRIYGQQDNPAFVQVGVLAASASIPALLDINKLVTRHSAVVGATGSGKSTTVAGLMNALSDPSRYPSARVLMIDVHGEYARALRDRATVFRVNANERAGEIEFNVPYWALTFDELLSISFGGLEGDAAVKAAFADKIVELKRQAFAAAPVQGMIIDEISVDTPIPFDIHKLWWDFHTLTRGTHVEDGNPQSPANWALELGDDGQPVQPGDIYRVIPPRFRPPKDEKGDSEKIRLSQSRLNVGRPTEVLAGRLRDRRLSFLFKPGPWSCANQNGTPEADLDTLFSQWIGSDRPITILDLSGIPPSIQSDLVGALLRVLYEGMFWGRNMPEGGKSRPLLIVLEEAHAYLGTTRGNAATTAVQRIAKEGRKYGLGLMIVSQRPAEIDETILSQCGTMVALRLSNSTDRSRVTSSVSDNLEGLLSALPILRTGEAIIAGEAVSLPIRAMVTPPSKDRSPDSMDPKVVNIAPDDDVAGGVGGWNVATPPAQYEKLVAAWRLQSVRSMRDGGNAMDVGALVWTQVTSSNVKAVAHETQTGTMYVEFTSGAIYQYFDVPERVFEDFLQSSSKGTYFNTLIKNRYRYERG